MKGFVKMLKRRKALTVEMVRSVDALGRIIIPREIGALYNINCEDKLTVIATKDGILLAKAETE